MRGLAEENNSKLVISGNVSKKPPMNMNPRSLPKLVELRRHLKHQMECRSMLVTPFIDTSKSTLTIEQRVDYEIGFKTEKQLK
jgi:hypothetical protein